MIVPFRLYFVFICILIQFSTVNAQESKLIVQTGHSTAVSDLTFHSTKNIVASSGYDGRVILWDLNANKQLDYYDNHTQPVNKILFYKDWLISAGEDGQLLVKDIVTFEFVFKGKFNFPIRAIEIDTLKKQLWVGGEKLLIFNLVDFSYNEISNLQLKNTYYNDFSFNSKNDLIALSIKGKHVTIINSNFKKVKVYRVSAASSTFDSSGNSLYIAGLRGKLRKYSINRSKVFHYSIPSKKWIDGFHEVTLIQKKGLFAGANRNGQIMIYKINGGNLECLLHGHSGPVRAMTVSHDNRFLISAGDDRKLIVWDLEDGTKSAEMKGLGSVINCIEIYKGKILTGDAEGNCRIIDYLPDVPVQSISLSVSAFNKIFGWRIRVNQLSSKDTTGKVLVQAEKFKEIKKRKGFKNKSKVQYFVWNLADNTIKKVKELKHQKSNENKTALISEIEKRTIKGEIAGKDFSFLLNYIPRAQVVWKEKELIIATSDDAILHFYDVLGNELLKMITVGESDKILLTTDNHYSASKGALKGVGFTFRNQSYSFEQFDIYYNRPDLVYNVLNNDAQLLIELEKAYKKRISKLGLKLEELQPNLSTIPELKIDDSKLIKSTNNSKISIPFIATSESSPINKIHCEVNGVPIYGENTLVKGNHVSGELTIELSSGNNTIQLSSVNEEGIESFIKEFSVVCRKKTTVPNLYIVTLGASKYLQLEKNLNYAHKDALDIVKTFKKNNTFDNVYVKTFLNEEVTRQNIKEVESFISAAGVDDVVMLFYSGHGVLDNNLDYYLGTYEMDFSVPNEKGILYSDFEIIMTKTKARKKILFLDACHSGEFDKEEVLLTKDNPAEEGVIVFRNGNDAVTKKSTFNGKTTFELSKALFADLGEKNGAYVISSAGGAEFAMEGDNWKNGLFTYILLKGLTTKEADLNHDKKVMVSELQRYIFTNVTKLSQGKQIPTSRVSNLNVDFRVW